MYIWPVFLILVTDVTISVANPIIFEDITAYCRYSSRKKKHVDVASNVLSAFKERMTIYYKLCGSFDNDVCPKGSAACLYSDTIEKASFGTHFVLVGDNKFTSVDGGACSASKNYSLTVNLRCFDDGDDHEYIDPSLASVAADRCEYTINMNHPKCLPRCTTIVDGKLIDLRPLTKSFVVKSKDKNFSVSLCKPDPSCGGDNDDINACEFRGNETIPLSLDSSIALNYNGDTNRLIFNGFTYKRNGQKHDKKFEVKLKCDWDKDEAGDGDLEYVPKPVQGRQYSFELRTSFGCIKRPVPCVINDRFLIYNLSGLYAGGRKTWSANDGRGTFRLQMCGPLSLEGNNTNCTHAQACENVDGVNIDRGSVMRPLEVVDDVVKVAIENGMRCSYDPKRQYETFVDLSCERQEKGPKLRRRGECDAYFEWGTPHACPQYDATSCARAPSVARRNCSFVENGNHYDLNELNEDRRKIATGSREFLLSVCGHVIDADAPCMWDASVAMKDLDQYNVKHRTISLGKFYRTSVKNGNLVIEYAAGSFYRGSDCRSEIHFVCGQSEEAPVVAGKKGECSFEFRWKSRHACPVGVRSNGAERRIARNCTFTDYRNGKSVDFGSMSRTALHVKGDKYKYTFDICQRNYTKCTLNNEECSYVPFKSSTFRTGPDGAASLEATFPNRCPSRRDGDGDDFDAVDFVFTCDRIENNDHVEWFEPVGCLLRVKYATGAACSSTVIPSESGAECLVKSPYTDRQLNFTELQFDSIFADGICPSASFNASHRFVRLFYVSNETCPPSPANNVTYELFLKCSPEPLLQIKNETCRKRFNLEKADYCDLFDLPGPAVSASTIGTIVGAVSTVVAAVALTICALARKRLLDRGVVGFTSIYEKDTEI